MMKQFNNLFLKVLIIIKILTVNRIYRKKAANKKQQTKSKINNEDCFFHSVFRSQKIFVICW